MSNLRFALLAVPALLSLAACEDPAKDAPKAIVMSAAPTSKPAAPPATAAAAATQAAPAAGSEKLALDTATSTVGFVGSKVTGKHEGKFEKVSGSISLAGGKAEGGKIEIEVDVASLKTDQEKLDGHLKSPDFFDVAKFPKATFTSTEIKAGGDEGRHPHRHRRPDAARREEDHLVPRHHHRRGRQRQRQRRVLHQPQGLQRSSTRASPTI